MGVSDQLMCCMGNRSRECVERLKKCVERLNNDKSSECISIESVCV